MLLAEKSTGHLLEVLDIFALVDPVEATVKYGEEAQHPEPFAKVALTFPSGKRYLGAGPIRATTKRSGISSARQHPFALRASADECASKSADKCMITDVGPQSVIPYREGP